MDELEASVDSEIVSKLFLKSRKRRGLGMKFSGRILVGDELLGGVQWMSPCLRLAEGPSLAAGTTENKTNKMQKLLWKEVIMKFNTRRTKQGYAMPAQSVLTEASLELRFASSS